MRKAIFQCKRLALPVMIRQSNRANTKSVACSFKQLCISLAGAKKTTGIAPRIALTALLLVGAGGTGSVLAQSEEASVVSVIINGVEDELLTNVRGFLPLYRFKDKQAPSTGRLRLLHRQAEEKIPEALAPFGYYRPTVTTDLVEADGVWQATYTIEPGDQIVLETVDIVVSGEAENDPAFIDAVDKSALKAGTPLLHEQYESLKRRFQVLASERGYFDSQLTESRIRINLEKYQSSATLHFDSGMRYYLGDVIFKQDKPWLSEGMLDRFQEIETGQPYLANDLQQLQGDLANTEYFSEVTLDVSPQNADENRVIPVIVNLAARNPTRYSFGAGYGTDTGARVKAGLTRRRINEAGHHFAGELLLAELKFGIAGDYIIPGSDPRTDSWGLRGSVQDENSDASNFTSYTIGGYYRHRDQLWIKTYSLDYLVETFEEASDDTTSRLLIPGIKWTRTYPAGLDERISPAFGTLLQLSVRGGSDDLLSDTSFVQPMISAKFIYSFGNSSRFILRGAAGTTSVDDFEQLPTSLRFFSGGDKTVRGYGYHVIGPEMIDDVVGGKNLLESSVELEIPVSEKWSLAAFADVGDAFDDDPDYKTGVGLGVRWRSPIGPVRIDFGHALEQPPGRKLRAHLTIGSDL